jgi:hypothetical protein
MTGKNGKISNNLDSSSIKNIVFFDSSCNFENFKNILDTSDLIITFDYFSHNLLTSKKIVHEISDNFILESDLSLIQKKSYHFSEWYSKDLIQKILNYEGVNLGELYYAELHYFLVPFLKKLLEIQKISSQFVDSNFISSGILYQIIKNHSENSVEIQTKNKSSEEFLYDLVQFPLKIGTFSHTLKFSRKNYKKIKSFSDKIINQLFGYKKRFSENNKSVLFVEFDTVRYEKLLSESKNYPINLVSFCRRRPSIWNNSSFNIIKNSNCIIETESSVKNNFTKIDYQNIAKNKLSQLWTMDHFFQDFFSLNGKSFWIPLSQFFKELTEKRFPEAISEINIAKDLFQKYDFSSVLVWSELGFNEKILIKLGKQKHIPIVLIQHGLGFETEESVQHTKFMGGIPKYVDHYIVWGDSFRDFLIKSNFQKEKIAVLGSALHDNFDNYLSSIDKNYILLTTSSPVKNLVKDLLIQTHINYENSIKEICKITKKLNQKLIIKLHPDFEEIDISNLLLKINSDITILKNGNIFDLISSSKLLITIDLSTTILESQILRKPVFTLSVKNYDFGTHELFTYDSQLMSEIENFETKLTIFLNDQQLQEKKNQDQINYSKYYFSNLGNASNKILDFLVKL